ncbi:MAG: S66 peptidase family protein [Myxococcaceae bacterium]
MRSPRLRPGDRVAVVSPSSPFDRERFDRGMTRLAERYELAPHPSLLERHRYLAGSDDVRTGALLDAFNDPGNRAVVCARGGSGAARLLPRIDFGRLPLKPLVGFSDNCVLHAALQSNGRISVHGPVVTQLADQPPWVSERLFALLEGRVPDPLPGTPIIPGVVEGPLLGGDLVVFATLLGTRWLPDMTGAILLLEEVDEPPYRIDRVWTHLRNAGVFSRIAGIALGQFLECEPKDKRYDPHTCREVLVDLATETGVPCIADLPIGHGAVNAPVALGARHRLDAHEGMLQPLEAATA